MLDRKMSVWSVLFIATLLLNGCDEAESIKAGPSAKTPATIERAMNTEFPADGRIHLLYSEGYFDIGPTTQFCTVRPGYGLDGRQLREALEDLGQSSYLNGTSRLSCQIDHRAGEVENDELGYGKVMISMRKMQSDHKPSYRLVLAAWQDDSNGVAAVWVGGIERRNGLRDEHIEIAAEDSKNFESYSRASVGRDSSEITEMFIRSAINGDAK
ncbi:hypothetical protein ACXYN8_11660 [Altererythrobacter sp. CAU 1778]